jgi:twitching motility protein PilT
MSLVPSLLQAIVRVDGEALVMHAGDKPYVVSPTGQVELASKGLALEAVTGIVSQLLPVELQHALEEFGAVQYELPAAIEFPGEQFTVVAARGGDDVWIEIRRRHVDEDDRVPDDLLPPRSPAAVQVDTTIPTGIMSAPPVAAPVHVAPEKMTPPAAAIVPPPAVVIAPPPQAVVAPSPVAVVAPPPAPVVARPAAPVVVQPPEISVRADASFVELADDDLLLPEADQLWGSTDSPAHGAVEQHHEVELGELAAPLAALEPPPVVEPLPTAVIEPPRVIAPLPMAVIEPPRVIAPPPQAIVEPPPVVVPPPMAVIEPPPVVVPLPMAVIEPPPVVLPPPMAVIEPLPVVVLPPMAVVEPPPVVVPPPMAVIEPPPAVLPPPTAVIEPPPVVLPPPMAVIEPLPVVVSPPMAAAAPPIVVAEPPLVVASPPMAVAEPPTPIAPPLMAVPLPPLTVAPAATLPPLESYPAPRMAAVPPPRPIAPSEPVQPAVVLPIARNPIRPEWPLPSIGDPTMSGLDRLLRTSAARGASTLYLSSESRPSVRVDGELQVLDGEPVLTSRDVESLLLTLMPERSHEALRTGAATEWICDIEGVGRVRCMSFRDHCGPGGVFRLMPTRTVTVDQLGLPQAVQALTIEPEGLVLVAGPRSSGKRTLLSAFVDAINRTRRDHVITIEREINIVHERGNSFISQREVRGSDDEMLAAARAALREDPDVLVIEDLRTGGLMNVALEAAASGHLVVGGFSAHTATGAIDRIIDLYAPEFRRQVQLALANSLRGVIVQVLLRRTGGGRVATREVLLNTPAVSSVIAEGKTSQLPMAIEGGRRYGMMPLNDGLVGLVQSGVVEAREAYRQTTDRGGLLAALKRHGVDTSFVEKLA